MNGRLTKNHYLLLPAAGLLVALAWLAFVWKPQAVGGGMEGLPGILAERPSGGDFTLESARGNVALQDFRGKVVLLYFGYTSCPDICPTSLAMTAAALKQLTPEEQAKVQTIFVSVDPERDGLEHLQTYVRFFHPSFIGVSGEPDMVKTVARQYGAAYRRVESNSAMGYLVDHSAYTYLIDREGHLREAIPHGSTPGEVVSALRKYL